MANWRSLPDRFRRWLRSPVDVPLVCEIAADYVAAVRHHQGRVDSWAVWPLPEGAVRPAPTGDNVLNPGAVQEALGHVLASVANGHRRSTLLVPDLSARVVVLEFDRLPGRHEEIEALLRWRLSKDLPFDIRQAALSYQLQPGRSGTQEAVVAVCLRAVLRQYEESLERLGLQPGWVICSTLAAVGCLGPAPAGASVLVKRNQGAVSLAVIHEHAVRLFRSLPAAASSAGRDAALLEKVYPAVVYFREQWSQAVERVVVTGAERLAASSARQLEQEVGCAVVELSLDGFDLPASSASGAAPDYRLVSTLGWVQGETE